MDTTTQSHMQTNLIKQQNMGMLSYCIHCGNVCYNRKLCPLCERALNDLEKHSLLIGYLAVLPFITEYILTTKEPTNEFIIIHGGEFEIFKRQVLTLEMWNNVVEHLLTGYKETGILLTELFGKRDAFNKNIMDANRKLDDFIRTVIKKEFPDYQIEYDPEKDFVSVNEIRKYIWRCILQRDYGMEPELQIIEGQDDKRKWAVINDNEKVYNIIRIYSGRELDEEQVTRVIGLFQPPTGGPRLMGGKLLKGIEKDYWDFQIILTDLFTKLKNAMSELYGEITSTGKIKGHCKLCEAPPALENKDPEKYNK